MLCTSQLVELQQNYDKIQSLGAELIAISSENMALTEQTVENHSLKYLVLSDDKKQAINAYNVLDQSNRTIARPATYILNTNGTVAWKSLDAIDVRVPTATVLTALGKL